MKKTVNMIDIPIEELILEIQDKYEICSQKEEEIYNLLKKTKIILKRERAKKRKKDHRMIQHFKEDYKMAKINLKIPITEEEEKRKKNRISAQISRDKKKEFYTKIQKENNKFERILSSQ